MEFEERIVGNEMDAHSLLLKICRRAERKGYSNISIIIRKYIPLIRQKDTEVVFGTQEVADLSKKSKIESDGTLFIETRSGDWFHNDKKIISELINSKKLDGIRCIFSSPNYPFDNAIKQMEKHGIKVTIAPVGISCNISDTTTFYYTIHHRYDELKRISENAIWIKGRIGRRLSKELKKAFLDQFSSALNMSTINKRYNTFLTSASKNPTLFDNIKELIFEKDLEIWEKILLYIYISPIISEKYPSMKSVSDIFGGEKIIEEIIEQLEKDKIIEFISGKNQKIKLKLTNNTVNNHIPRFMVTIFNYRRVLLNHPQIGKIVSQYRLRWKDFGFNIKNNMVIF